MAAMTIELTPEMEKRVGMWQKETNGDTASMMAEALERYLEDWEDYTDAVQICAEVDAGRMKTYTQEEIDREFDERVAG